jgi:two-component system NtrC family sensor kinase
MKKTLLLLLIFFAFAKPVLAQLINIDSIVKVVASRNKHSVNGLTLNKDSLYRRLPFARPGAQRVKLINDLYYYGLYPDIKQETDMGYKILAWAKAHHDLIAEAVICAEQGATMSQNGDEATALQLGAEAMAAAKAAHDDQALGIVYQNIYQSTFAKPGIRLLQTRDAALQSLKFARAANDTLTMCWGYEDMYIYYYNIKKTDSAAFYIRKALDWAIRANRLYDICFSINQLGDITLINGHTDERLKLRCYRGALALSQLANDASSIYITSGSLANFYLNKNIDSALFYAYKAYHVGKRISIQNEAPFVDMIAKAYTQKRNIDSAVKYLKLYDTLNTQLYNNKSMVRAQAITFAQKQKEQLAEADKTALKNSRQRWILTIVIVFLLLIALIFWRNNRLTRKANARLAQQKLQTELTLADLKATQQQLIQSAKMASLGELTAGIAHEIQNPLNFVNNFSEVNGEILEELKDESEKPKAEWDEKLVVELINDLVENEQKINQHGKRADGIVKGMLEHSRASTGQKEPTDLNKLVDEYFKLAYHSLQAKDKTLIVQLVTNFDENLPPVNIISQDIGRVLLNLFNNAFYAVNQKSKIAGVDYKPAVEVTTFYLPLQGLGKLRVRDNGNGIPGNIKDKIMQPFFTTKPTGQGIGLGLSLSYDIIVKGHGGQLTATSVEGEFAEFEISIPI